MVEVCIFCHYEKTFNSYSPFIPYRDRCYPAVILWRSHTRAAKFPPIITIIMLEFVVAMFLIITSIMKLKTTLHGWSVSPEAKVLHVKYLSSINKRYSTAPTSTMKPYLAAIICVPGNYWYRLFLSPRATLSFPPCIICTFIRHPICDLLSTSSYLSQ